MPSLQHVCLVCKKAWQTVISSKCLQGLINRQIRYHDCTFVMAWEQLWLYFQYTLPFVLYADTNVNSIYCRVHTVVQIVIGGKMTEIPTSLQTWQCFYPVKPFHSHNAHLTSDNIKGFPCNYSYCIFSNQLYKTIIIYCGLLPVKQYY